MRALYAGGGGGRPSGHLWGGAYAGSRASATGRPRVLPGHREPCRPFTCCPSQDRSIPTSMTLQRVAELRHCPGATTRGPAADWQAHRRTLPFRASEAPPSCPDCDAPLQGSAVANGGPPPRRVSSVAKVAFRVPLLGQACLALAPVHPKVAQPVQGPVDAVADDVGHQAAHHPCSLVGSVACAGHRNRDRSLRGRWDVHPRDPVEGLHVHAAGLDCGKLGYRWSCHPCGLVSCSWLFLLTRCAVMSQHCIHPSALSLRSGTARRMQTAWQHKPHGQWLGRMSTHPMQGLGSQVSSCSRFSVLEGLDASPIIPTRPLADSEGQSTMCPTPPLGLR